MLCATKSWNQSFLVTNPIIRVSLVFFATVKTVTIFFFYILLTNSKYYLSSDNIYCD